jgi:uncharacterized membrane protein
MQPLAALHRYLATRLFYPIAAASALALALLLLRAYMVGALEARFLIWNLLLAWMPYLLALMAERSAGRGRRGRWRTLVCGLLWLLFLPNAPYIITDFVHLGWMDFVWWYDVGTLLAFAWAGCLLGVASLHIMQTIVRARAGVLAGWAFALICCGLSGLGIYLGRFLRWNSWDVLLSPRGLAHEMLQLLSDPASYPRMVGVSGMFAAFLALGALTLAAARRVGR